MACDAEGGSGGGLWIGWDGGGSCYCGDHCIPKLGCANSNPVVETIDSPTITFWGWVVGCTGFLLFFISSLFFGLVCWFGFISTYSIELGFRGSGYVGVPLLWCYARKYCVLHSVLFYYLRNSELPLHVVRLFWNTMSREMGEVVHLDVGNKVVS